MKMKTSLFALIAIAPFLSTPSNAAVFAPIDSSYKLTFDDEFNGSTLDLAKWTPNFLGTETQITPSVNKTEGQAYDPAQVRVAGGSLQLNLVYNPVTTMGYSYQNRSGMVQTFGKFSQAYGYFEARIYLPGSMGRISNWPAFWLAGMGTWPATGELDVMEGLQGVAGSTFHSNAGMDQAIQHNADYTGWHVFAALWEPGSVKAYYDGKLVGTLTKGITASPQYILLNLATGGCCSGPAAIPSQILIDYVHAYSKDPKAIAVAPQAGYKGPGDDGTAVLSPSPSTTNFSITSPTPNSAVSKSIVVKGKAGSKWVNVAAFDVVNGYRKLSADSRPVNGEFSLAIDGSSFSAGIHTISVFAFSVPAGQSGGESQQIELPLNITSPESSNLVKNPGLENGASDWILYGQASVSTSEAYEGTRALKISGGISGAEQTLSKLLPNTSYTLSAFVKNSDKGSVVIGVKDQGTAQIVKSAAGAGYGLIKITFKTGSQNTKARIFFYGENSTGFADKFSLRQD